MSSHTPAAPTHTATPAPAPDARDRDLVELHRFADGSREVRPDDEHQTGQAPPEELGGDESDAADGVAQTTRGDGGGTG